MPNLLETQHAFLRAILGHENAEVGVQIGRGTFTPAERLDVYRNTFLSTLTNALRISFPAVQGIVGEEFFEGAAQYFVEAQPPDCAYLNAYGGGFADFLAQFPPAAGLPYLSDVARLEWAVNRALHAEDVPRLEPQAVAELSAPPEHIAFIPHPSVTLLRLHYPARAIWQAVLAEDENALSEINLEDAADWLLIERGANGVEVTALPEEEWRFAHALCAGRGFAAAMDAASDADIPLFLARHIAAGRIVGFRVSGDHASETTP